MDLTGNPFVDTGLMVLAALAEVPSVADLCLSDIRRVFGDGLQLARDNATLKCFTMVFGTNGPLTQPAYKKAAKNGAVYLGILKRLLDAAESEGSKGPLCDLTGIRTEFDFHRVCAEALRDAGLEVPDRKWLGRDWIPLGGSLGNDAQALPSASRPLRVSALALFAMQYLPLGTFLFKGKLVCYQSTAVRLSQALTENIVTQNQQRLALGEIQILGKGSGTGIILDLLLHYFESLRDVVKDEALPAGTELVLWLFSNFGTGADCSAELVPESALAFVHSAMSQGFASEIRRLMSNDGKDSRFQLFECIRNANDYPKLYPAGKWLGTSPEFYDFYQSQVRGIDLSRLCLARKLAAIVSEGCADKKALKQIRTPDFLRTPAGKNRVRKSMVDALFPREYDTLFPSTWRPIRVQSAAWDLLRFYMSRPETDVRPIPELELALKTTHPKIIQIADAYITDSNPKKLKSLLDRMAQRKVGLRWLQDLYCRMAEQHKDWNLASWDEFVCDEEGNYAAFELFFQIRLHLSNRYREMMAYQKGEVA